MSIRKGGMWSNKRVRERTPPELGAGGVGSCEGVLLEEKVGR